MQIYSPDNALIELNIKQGEKEATFNPIQRLKSHKRFQYAVEEYGFDTYDHKCESCGAHLTENEVKNLIECPICGTVY